MPARQWFPDGLAMKRVTGKTHPPLDRPVLRELALAYLARFAATEIGLQRVLERHIERWAREMRAAGQEAEREIAEARVAAREITAELVACGAVDDASFAAARAQRLVRTGRSRRAVAAHLAARGVKAATIEAVLPGAEETELAAALIFARRRRIGPFRSDVADEQVQQRELGVLARAGFPQTIAVRALSMNEDEAERLIAALRRGG